MRSSESNNGFPATRLGRGIAALAHDAATVAELQAKLVALDLKASSRFIRLSLLLGIAGGTLLFACLPVGLIGVAELLVAVGGWNEWVAYLAVAIIGILASAMLFWLGWRTLQKSSGMMHRSQEELARNLQWFKAALRGEQASREAASTMHRSSDHF